MHTLKFRLAEHRDIAELVKLINSAYRYEHENSWTNESLLVKGDRIDQQQLDVLIQKHENKKLSSQLLIAELNEQCSDEIIGCVLIEYFAEHVEIGTFCIAPQWQNAGYGQQVLRTAEIYAQKFKPELRFLSVWVLDVRSELIEFYIRRGYHKTNVLQEYPVDAGVGDPLVELKLIQLNKIA